MATKRELPLHELTKQFDIGRTAVSKHLKILNDVGLVEKRKVGREIIYTFNAKPLKAISHWVSFYEAFWIDNLKNLDHLLKQQTKESIEEKNMAADVILDFHYEAPQEQVWKALTEAELLAKWILDNDFKAEVGYQFNFKGEPNEWWDGVITGEVINVEEPSLLSYSWNSAGEETVITWTLKTDANNETDLHFEMNGFSEETKARPGAIDGAIYSWTEFANKLANVLANN